MNIECPHCHKVYDLNEHGLPDAEKVTLPCPNCKEFITLNFKHEGGGETVWETEPLSPEKPAGDRLKNRILTTVRDLPPMPQTILKAQEILKDPLSSFDKLAKVLQTDQAIAARILRMANSPFYGMMGKISSLQHASTVLGVKNITEIIIVAGTSDLLSGKLEGYGMASGDLWLHSLGVAFASRIISTRKKPALANDAFVAGLIHDAGKLALDPYIFERLESFNAVIEGGIENFTSAEKRILGFDHAELVGELCKSWNVPKPLRTAVRYHHKPAESGGSLLAFVVHMADAIAMMSGMGAGLDGLQYDLDPEAMIRLGIQEDDVAEIMQEVVESVQKITEEM